MVCGMVDSCSDTCRLALTSIYHAGYNGTNHVSDETVCKVAVAFDDEKVLNMQCLVYGLLAGVPRYFLNVYKHFLLQSINYYS